MGSRLQKNSESVRKRIETHTFDGEDGDEYEGSKFGGFGDYFRRKKIKLQNLDADIRSSSSSNPQIFRGIVAHVNGYTQPSLNDLHKLIVSHGGGFMQYLDGKTTVTHVIAANLTPKKAVEFKQYRIVKPAWIVDSVKAGKLLPWSSYRVIDEGVNQRLLGFQEGKIVSQTNTSRRGYRDQTDTSWYTGQVQNIADDIDDEGGAHFPSSQVLAINGMTDYMESPDHQPKKNDPETPTEAISPPGEYPDEYPDSSAGFEVTSSLEEALNQVTKGTEPASPSLPKGLQAAEDPTEQVITPSDCKPPPKPLNHFTETESPSPSNKAKVLTAEEHNAVLLSDPHIRKSSTANPNFIQQYYSESRLHHLSTWKADLKARFQQMASERSASQKPAKRKPGSRRYIMHVDFDSFFCAVSLKNAPEYIDKPAVVAHGSGSSSEIASCNYPARAFGVKNGMWMKKASTLCPDIKVLPYDFPAYEEASRGFYEAIIDVGGIVQSVSVDEALVDITALCLPAGGTDGFGIKEGSIWQEQEKADQISQKLRAVIKKNTDCDVSIGIGGNILLAKLALRKAKPAGQYQIKPEEILDFIGELTVTALPGVAHSIEGKLEEIGVKFVKDVRQLTKERLMDILGPKTGEKIWEYVRGIDKVEVGEQAVRKSVSAEVNWGIRFISQQEAEKFVQNLCIELQRRLIEQKVKGRQMTMKIMKKAADAPMDPPKNLGHGKCDTYNKSVTLGVATNNAEVTSREAISILRSYGFSPGELRGLGVQMTKLEPTKGAAAGPFDSSQRRIDFGRPAAPKSHQSEDPVHDSIPQQQSKITTMLTSVESLEDPIDESVTPKKSKPTPAQAANWDPIDDIDSPEKTKSTPVHPAAAITRANAADKSANKFLNLTGTQFILPTQVDPAVLAELPKDIRSKLMAQNKSRLSSKVVSSVSKLRFDSHAPPDSRKDMPLPSQYDPEVFAALPEEMKAELLGTKQSARPESRQSSRHESPAFESRPGSPASPEPQRHAPLPLQYDPEVFAALPDDMKAEVLASLHLVPSTARKLKPPPAAKRWTPTKKRGRPPGSKNRKEDPHAILMQSNFVNSKHDFIPDVVTEEDETLDLDFLAALPEDMRAEVIAEHRQKQLAKKGALVTAVLKKRRKPPEPAPLGPRRLKLPPRPPKPTFTTAELSTPEQLRETIGVWYREFADEGPNLEDVGTLERYLRRVVVDERDLAKVQGVVKWTSWLIEDGEGTSKEGIRLWEEAIRSIKEKVQNAVRERGLGPLDL
ncbi:hypothetical protein B0O99DRAFT_641954 [Bisporella sp. PMI_857]|nr:hypothetical protein B0O99DRAFT_641954 [Bisporella sp. PMI_857]